MAQDVARSTTKESRRLSRGESASPMLMRKVGEETVSSQIVVPRILS